VSECISAAEPRLPCSLVTKCHVVHKMGTPRYSDRLCSDRHYSNRHYSDNPQSGRRRRVADCSWIGLRAIPIGKTSNQIPKIRDRGQYNCVGALEVGLCCNFSGGGAPQTSPEYPPTPQGPGLTPLGHIGAWINDVLSMHVTPRPPPILFQFLLFLHMLKRAKDVAYWVIFTVGTASVGTESVGIVSASRTNVSPSRVMLSTTIRDVVM